MDNNRIIYTYESLADAQKQLDSLKGESKSEDEETNMVKADDEIAVSAIRVITIGLPCIQVVLSPNEYTVPNRI